MEYSNKNLTFAGIGVLALALIWFVFFGANTTYLRGALMDDLDCGAVEGYETVFARESIEVGTTSFRPTAENASLQEVFDSNNNSDLQVRIYNNSQACNEQTVIKCDSRDIQTFEDSFVFICNEEIDENSNYFLRSQTDPTMTNAAYYLQALNPNDPITLYDDVVYTLNQNSSDFNAEVISNYQVLIQER